MKPDHEQHKPKPTDAQHISMQLGRIAFELKNIGWILSKLRRD